jgi:hypothetical protein
LKKDLGLAFAVTTSASAVMYSIQTGYGTSISLILEAWAWEIIALLSSPRFSDTHVPIVSAVAGVLCGALLIIILGVVLGIAKRMGSLQTARSRVGTVVIVTALYFGLVFFAFPLSKGP